MVQLEAAPEAGREAYSRRRNRAERMAKGPAGGARQPDASVLTLSAAGEGANEADGPLSSL